MAPGVQVNRMDANKWAITIRGFNGRFANKLLVLMDGRTIYTPLFAGVFWEIQDYPLADIDRIEVIRGGSGTLWGANAFNGVINIITKKAEKAQGFLLSTGAGSEEKGFATMRYGSRIGKNIFYRVYGKAFSRDSFTLDDGGQGNDDYRMGHSGFRLDWVKSHSETISLHGDYYNGELGQTVSVPDFFSPLYTKTLDENANVQGKNDEISFFNHHLRLISGVRLEHNDYTGYEFEPGIRSIYTTDGGQTVWAAISRGIRTPSRLEQSVTFNQRVIPPGYLFPGLPASMVVMHGSSSYDSEEVLSYELGLRSKLSTRIFMDVSFFYNHYDNMLSFRYGMPEQPLFNLPATLGNEVGGHSYGAELACTMNMTEDWRLMATYSFMTMDLDDYFTLDLRIGWQFSKAINISLTGQNLLHDHHREYGTSTLLNTQITEVDRGFYVKVNWRL